MSELFLSRLVLNPRSRQVQRDLVDCRSMHQQLMKAFPIASSLLAREEFGVLYRVEVDWQTGEPTVLVQSNVEPDWTRGLHDEFLLSGSPRENPTTKSIGPIYDGLNDGARLRFRLRANPTKRLHLRNERAGDLAGKRVELVSEQEQADSLLRKGTAQGFAVVSASVLAGDVFGWKQSGNRKDPAHRLTFATAVFDGVLEITDRSAFRQAVAAGIGPGKAYGFGLLSIAPHGG